MKLTEQQAKMVEDNHNLIYGYANKKGLDLDEWYGLLALELCKTVPKYNPKRSALSTYYYLRCDSLVKVEYDKTQAQMRSHNGIFELDDNLLADDDDSTEERMLLKAMMKYGHEEVIKLRYEGYTQSEIAEKLGVSQPYISAILDEVYAKYKEDRDNEV